PSFLPLSLGTPSWTREASSGRAPSFNFRSLLGRSTSRGSSGLSLILLTLESASFLETPSPTLPAYPWTACWVTPLVVIEKRESAFEKASPLSFTELILIELSSIER